MQPLAATLSDQDISDLAVYYEAQTPAGLEADPSYWQGGQALYLRGDRAREVRRAPHVMGRWDAAISPPDTPRCALSSPST